MKRLFKYLFVFMLVGLLIASLLFVSLVDIPDSARLVKQDKACVSSTSTSVIDVGQPLNIAVWNIYKQQNTGWQAELNKLTAQNQIVLLQEAVSSTPLVQKFTANNWHSEQAFAFAIDGEVAGVMTAAEFSPVRVCAFAHAEPLLPFPKTALVSFYPLSNQQQLAVINIHSVNFTLDMSIFSMQITRILASLDNFAGPIIFAGDFNTWRDERMTYLTQALGGLGLQQVRFTPDQRLRVFNAPLDHIFYRGLQVVQAQSVNTEASDHAWMEARFIFD